MAEDSTRWYSSSSSSSLALTISQQPRYPLPLSDLLISLLLNLSPSYSTQPYRPRKCGRAFLPGMEGSREEEEGRRRRDRGRDGESMCRCLSCSPPLRRWGASVCLVEASNVIVTVRIRLTWQLPMSWGSRCCQCSYSSFNEERERCYHLHPLYHHHHHHRLLVFYPPLLT